MGSLRLARLLTLLALALALGALPAWAQNPFGDIIVQCPGDANGDAVPDETCPADAATGSCLGLAPGDPNPDYDPNVICRHVAGGDGFVTMADRKAAS